MKNDDIYCRKCGQSKHNLFQIEEPVVIKKGKERGDGSKTITTALLIIIFFGIIISMFWFMNETEQRKALQNVQLSLSDVQIKSIGLSRATLEVYINMYNPNNGITATLDRMDYTIYANGNNLGNGQINRRVDIPPQGTKTVSSTFQVSYAGAIGTAWSALTGGGDIKWNLKGTAYFDTPLGTLNIPINQYK